MEEGIGPQTRKKKKKTLLIVGAISVVIAVVLASTLGWYFLISPGSPSRVTTGGGGGGGGGNATGMTIIAPTSVNEGSNFNVTVKNATSPLNGVMVLFATLTKYTNANGNATFTAPDVNVDTQYDITANKTGYKNATKIITVVNTGGPPVKVFNAKNPPHMSIAEANATKWSPDAVFVGCGSNEGEPLNNWPDWMKIDTSQDTTKLDGKCMYWGYTYYSQSKNRTYTVIVYENGTIPVTNETSPSEIPEEIVNWNVDSVPAASNAVANQTFNDFFQNHQSYTIIYLLSMNETHVPTWTIYIIHPTLYIPYCCAIIDAANGDVVEVFHFP